MPFHFSPFYPLQAPAKCSLLAYIFKVQDMLLAILKTSVLDKGLYCQCAIILTHFSLLFTYNLVDIVNKISWLMLLERLYG